MKNNTLYYIGGWGRSGSTLLARFLSEYLNSDNVGEIRYIWDRGFQHDKLCGCGCKFSQCGYWCRVASDLDDFEPVKMVARIGSRSRKFQILTFLPFFSSLYASFFSKQIDVVAALYSGCFKASENNILIDSSKSPFYFSAISDSIESEKIFIHLIRSPYGVVNSWKKTKLTSDDESGSEVFPRYSITRSILQWSLVNFLCLLFKYRRGVRYVRVEYDSFVSNPNIELSKIVGDNERDSFEWFGNLEHTISGNPVRHKLSETPKLKIDNEWEEKLSKKEKFQVYILSFPYRLLERIL